MIPFDVEGCLSEIAEARRTDADGVNVQLGHAIADGFRRDFDAVLDMETVGVALAIGGVSTIALLQEHGGLSRTDLAEILALAGENLVRTARARAAEADEERAELEARFKAALANPRPMVTVGETGPVWLEWVLTWHPLNGAPPVEIPLRTHWVFSSESCGQFEVSTREVPAPAVGEGGAPCPS